MTRNISITPSRRQGWDLRFRAVENRDVLSELTGMYSRVPEMLVPTLHRLN